MTNKDKNLLSEAPIKAVDKQAQNTETIMEEELLEKLSWAGKLFFAGAAGYILGNGGKKMKLPIKIRGRPEEVKAVVNAIAASKRFQQELSKPGATIDSVIEKLRIRNLSKSNFKEIVGVDWPL